MNKLLLMTALLTTSFLAAPPAAAEQIICVNDQCVDVTALGDGSASCPSRHLSVSGTWYYMLGTIRDIPVDGTFYVATWSASTYYEKAGSGCREVAYSCKVQVTDGSHFEYVRVGTTGIASGEYKGIPTNGGYLTCGKTSARLHTFAAAALTLDGYGTKLI